MPILRLAVFVTALCLATPTYSQITLAEYRQSVYAASPELANAAATKEQSYSTMRQERTSFLPSLSATGSLKSALRRSAEGDKFWGFAMQPSISQTIYGGGAVRAAFNQAMTGYESSQYNEQAVMLYMRYAADYAYWNLSAQQLYKAATDEYVSIIKSYSLDDFTHRY